MMLKRNLVVFTITTLLLCNINRCSASELLLLVVSSSYHDYNTSVTVRTAVSSAIEMINNNSTLLVGNKLNYIEEDSMCDAERINDILQWHLQSKAPIAVIGCGCSPATEAIANTSLPLVSYGSPTAKLNNSTAYPSVFQTIPTFGGIFGALVEFFREFEWNQVMLITEEINFNKQDFINFLGRDILVSNQSVDSNNLFDTTNRVFILDAFGSKTRSVLCQAYKNNVYYPSYAWLILDNFIDDDWYTVPDTNCTMDEILRVLNYSIVIGPSPGNTEKDIYLYAYDSVMAVALAINEQMTNGDKLITDILKTISFQGLSGEVSFTQSYDDKIVFTQFINIPNSHSLTGSVIAQYEMNNLNITTTTSIIWPIGVPSDGITVIVIESVRIWAFTASILLSIFGITCGVVCFVFIFVYRNTSLIKLTSPKLNLFLLVGAFSVFFSIILYGYPSTDRHVFDVICPIQPFFGSILGYDLCVTIATVKLWRVYYIFKGPHPSQRIPKDWQLLLAVVVLISIDSLFSLIFIVIDVVWFPPMLIHENKPDSFDPATGEVKSFFFWDCRYSTYIFTIVALVHNFTVHGIGIGFTFKLRKIKISVLNEYHYNLVILITSIVITVIVVICVYTIGPDPSLYAFFYSLLVTTGCVIFIALTFIPKMVALYKDPKGDNIFPDNVGNDFNNIKAYDSNNEAKPNSKIPSSNDQE